MFWEEGKPTGILVPKDLVGAASSPVSSRIEVRLSGNNEKILGECEYMNAEDAYLFRPLVPLTAGLTYDVFYQEQKLGDLTVLSPSREGSPVTLVIYPSADTLPANLLKFYFSFSGAMREGEALEHIHLLNNAGDTLSETFLDLQPELWNKERTQLTLWLDPGRIKRDLIPNQKLGNPLEINNRYRLVIDGSWKDATGFAMGENIEKNFFVTRRDDKLPRPSNWRVINPASGTGQPLTILFDEPMDYFLIKESIEIVNSKNEILLCTPRVSDDETIVKLTPPEKWKKGEYRIRVDVKLEDLAGNNLQRLFDRDITKQQPVTGNTLFEMAFSVR